MKKFIVRVLCFFMPIILITLPIVLIGCITGELIHIDWSIKKQQRNEEILVGMGYNDAESYFKLENTNYYKAEVLALGTSRVLQFSSRYFQKSFYNCGRGVTYNFDEYINFLKNLEYTPEVIILGLDQWIFNQAWNESCPNYTEYKEITYKQKEMMSIIRAMLNDYHEKKWTVGELRNYSKNCGFHGVVKNNGYCKDGSYYYGDVYRDGETTAKERLEDTFRRIEEGDGRFEWGTEVDKKSLMLLDELLEYCKLSEIKVIGILPPFAPSVYDEMVKSKNYTYVESLMQEIEPLFQKYEYEVFDYSNGAKVNVSDEYFIDGFHGSEIVYNLIIQQIMLSTNTLDGVVDEMELKKLYDNRYSELTFEIPL